MSPPTPAEAKKDDLADVVARHWSPWEVRRAVARLQDMNLRDSLPDPRGLGRAEYASLVVDACRRRGRLADLLVALGRERPIHASLLDSAVAGFEKETLGAITVPVTGLEQFDRKWRLGTVWSLLALGALAAHASTNPHVLATELFDDPGPLTEHSETELARLDGTAFYFTGSNLLDPTRRHRGGLALDYIMIDVYPADEWAAAAPSLTWHGEIARALQGDGSESERTDALVFLSAARSANTLGRGEVAVTGLPPANPYVSASGLRGVISLATRSPPAAALREGKAELDTRFEQAVSAGLDAIAAQDGRSVGIPSLETAAAVGGAPDAPPDRWLRILRAATGARGRLSTVVFGGWALRTESRDRNREAFSDAWRRFRLELAPETGSLAGGSLRPFLATMALTTLGRPLLSPGSVLALMAGILAAALSAILGWVLPHGALTLDENAIVAIHAAGTLVLASAVTILRTRGGR